VYLRNGDGSWDNLKNLTSINVAAARGRLWATLHFQALQEDIGLVLFKTLLSHTVLFSMQYLINFSGPIDITNVARGELAQI
jgi:hypothetical protein